MEMNNNKETNKGRGRPEIEVKWPQSDFTFKNALEKQAGNVCASSLRNKIKAATNNGSLSKVGTLSTPMGRPQDVYSVTPPFVGFSSNKPVREEQSCESPRQEEVAGQSMPLG